MFCKECGAQLADDSKFCNKCGAKIVNDNEDTTALPTAEQSQEQPSNVEMNNNHDSDFVEQPVDNGQKSNKAIIIAGAVLACAVLLFFMFGSNKNNQQADTKPAQTTETTNQQPKIELTSSDLSLCGVCIGDSKEKMSLTLGPERGTTGRKDKNYQWYHYGDLSVVIIDGVVTGFKSNAYTRSNVKTSNAVTNRGIRMGSSLQEVLEAYGNTYSQSVDEGFTIYDYAIKSVDGRDCLLRFSLKDNRVDHISAGVIGAGDENWAKEETRKIRAEVERQQAEADRQQQLNSPQNQLSQFIQAREPIMNKANDAFVALTATILDVVASPSPNQIPRLNQIIQALNETKAEYEDQILVPPAFTGDNALTLDTVMKQDLGYMAFMKEYAEIHKRMLQGQATQQDRRNTSVCEEFIRKHGGVAILREFANRMGVNANIKY